MKVYPWLSSSNIDQDHLLSGQASRKRARRISGAGETTKFGEAQPNPKKKKNQERLKQWERGEEEEEEEEEKDKNSAG